MDTQNTAIYVAIGVLFLILVIYFMYYRPSSSVPTAAPAPAPTTVSHFVVGPVLTPPANQPLDCKSPAAVSSATNYYNKQSDYATVFTMDPISSVQAGDSACDIKYQYTPVPGSARTDSGVDWRRFTYVYGTEGWHPVGVGEWKSGTLNT